MLEIISVTIVPYSYCMIRTSRDSFSNRFKFKLASILSLLTDFGKGRNPFCNDHAIQTLAIVVLYLAAIFSILSLLKILPVAKGEYASNKIFFSLQQWVFVQKTLKK